MNIRDLGFPGFRDEQTYHIVVPADHGSADLRAALDRRAIAIIWSCFIQGRFSTWMSNMLATSGCVSFANKRGVHATNRLFKTLS